MVWTWDLATIICTRRRAGAGSTWRPGRTIVGVAAPACRKTALARYAYDDLAGIVTLRCAIGGRNVLRKWIAF